MASIGDRIILKNICDPAMTGVYKGELLPLEENIWLYRGAMGTIFNIDQCFKPNTYHVLFDHALLPNRKMAVIEGKDDFEILHLKDMDIGNLQQAIRVFKFLNSLEHEKRIEHLIFLKVNLQQHELINQQVELKS